MAVSAFSHKMAAAIKEEALFRTTSLLSPERCQNQLEVFARS